MNHREPPQVPQGMRRAGQFLALLLLAAIQGSLPASAHGGVQATPAKPTGSVIASGGYLPAHGAPPLRFSEIVVPSEPAPALAATDPSNPVSSVGLHSLAPNQPASGDVSVRAPQSTGETVIVATPEHPAPLSILPDETRPQVRPEDIMPFFQVPRSGQNPAVIITPGAWAEPNNPPPIPSSATYIQK